MSNLGLALGGGGARGIAHIGVLKVLEEEKIEITSISGCSMGAIVGGLYAYFGNVKEVEDFVFQAIKNTKNEIFNLNALYKDADKKDKNYFEHLIEYIGERVNALKTLGRLSYFDEKVANDIFKMVPDVPIESLGIKFSAIATDLNSGEEINFTEGSLRTALKASSAIPGIFPPVALGSKLLVDGSASESVPVGRVREIGADRVLAVDVTCRINTMRPAKNVLDILYRTHDITSHHLSLLRLQEADLILRPKVKTLSWVDFDQAAEIITAGETAARENLAEIKKLVHRNPYLLQIEHYLKKLKGNTQKQFPPEY